MASTENPTEVGLKFPIHISKGIIEHNPGFLCLLQKLMQYLTPTGGLKKTENEFKKVEELLNLKKHDYLQYHIIHDNLNTLLINYEFKCIDAPSNSDTAKILKMLKDWKMRSEMQINLKDQMSEIFKEIIFENQRNFNISSTVKEKIISELGEIIQEQCKSLAKMHETVYVPECDLLPNALQLPDQLEREQTNLQQFQQKLNETKYLRNMQLEQYERVLIETIKLLQELILTCRLKGPSEQHSVICNHLNLQAEALGLKLQILRMEILCDTYTKEAIASLKRIHANLEEEMEETERQISFAQHALHSYEALGSSFNKLVSEYTSLKEEIDNKTWALENLEKKVTDS